MYYAKIRYQFEHTFLWYHYFVYFNSQDALQTFVDNFEGHSLHCIVDTGEAKFNEYGVLVP